MRKENRKGPCGEKNVEEKSGEVEDVRKINIGQLTCGDIR